jgi:hypothetical protein
MSLVNSVEKHLESTTRTTMRTTTFLLPLLLLLFLSAINVTKAQIFNSDQFRLLASNTTVPSIPSPSPVNVPSPVYVPPPVYYDDDYDEYDDYYYDDYDDDIYEIVDVRELSTVANT